MKEIQNIRILPVLNDSDYAHCRAIRRSVFIEEQGVPESIEIEHEKESHHFLALYKNVPAATGRYRLKEKFAKFERIATLKAFRGRGIARALMQSMQADCLDKYPDYLPILHAQTNAIPFYLKLGWVTSGDIFQEANIDLQLMILPRKDPPPMNT